MSTLKFCPECNNILYPKEDKEVRLLKHACRHCDYQEVSDNNIVFKMEIRKPSTDGNTGILKDAVADASLPRTRSAKCANCNHSESVFSRLQRRERKALPCSLFVATQIVATAGGTKDSDVRFIDTKTSLCPG